MDSHLIRIIRGEGGSLPLSVGERILLEFALNTFGEPLSQLILAGLSEEAEARFWFFTVTFEDAQGAIRRREIKIEPDERPDVITLLPWRREPMVILALLHLLLANHQRASAKLSYGQDEVLGLLEWEDNAESRFTLDQSVERYARLSYNWKLSHEELTKGNLAYYYGSSRFVSGYGNENRREDGQATLLISWIEFSSNFVQGLLGHSLWGVNWDSVRRLECTYTS
jgi:hypothetical protein